MIKGRFPCFQFVFLLPIFFGFGLAPSFLVAKEGPAQPEKFKQNIVRNWEKYLKLRQKTTVEIEEVFYVTLADETEPDETVTLEKSKVRIRFFLLGKEHVLIESLAKDSVGRIEAFGKNPDYEFRIRRRQEDGKWVIAEVTPLTTEPI